MINIKEMIYNRMLFEIKYQLKPKKLVINNISAQHKGHKGYKSTEDTHFEIFIISELFENKTRIERHRMIYKALSGEEFSSIHAISIIAKTPSEYNNTCQ